GEGFLGETASQGVYVVFGDRTIWSGEGGLVQDGWIAIDWIQPNQISEGAFGVEIEVKAGELDPEVNYHVATSAAHDLSQTDRSLDSFVAVTVLDETEPEPETPVADPQLSVTPTEDLDPTIDQTLTVEGEGYVGDGAEQGVYVLFGETSIWSG